MRCFSEKHLLLLVVVVGLACGQQQPWLDAPPGPRDDFDLFRMGDLGFSHFRIPVLATIEGPTPALVLFVSARKFSFMDWGTRGLVMRASHDGGRSWTPTVQVVTDPRANNVSMELAGHGLDGIGQGEQHLPLVHCLPPCKLTLRSPAWMWQCPL